MLRIWNVENLGAAPAALNAGGKRITSIAFSPKGETLAAGLAQGGAMLFDLGRTGAPPRALCAGMDVRSVAFSPDGKTLACGAGRGEISVSPVAGGNAPVSLLAHASSVNSLSFDPKGGFLASASSDGTLRLWDLDRSQSDPIALKGHEGWVSRPRPSRRTASTWSRVNGGSDPADLGARTEILRPASSARRCIAA